MEDCPVKRNRAVLSTFIVLSLFLCAPSLAFADLAGCIRFEISVHFGSELTPYEISTLEVQDPGSEYFNLGSGPGGGTVFRVIPPGEESHELKEYRKALTRDDDMWRFSVIHQKVPKDPFVEVVRPQALKSRSMRLPDIQGQPLDKVIRESKISAEEKAQLIKGWNEFVARVGNAFGVSQRIRPYETLHTLSFSIVTPGRTRAIMLKPDNVIVEAKTGRMFLVDPY